MRLRLLVGVIGCLLVACGGGGNTNPPGPNPNPNPKPNPNPAPGQCAVTITDRITVPSRLNKTKSACDYLVQGTIFVSSGLSIDPGVNVRFAQDASLYFDSGGSLTAVGTPQARIRLEGANPVKGYWNGLSWGGGSRESRIEYADILWAGQDGLYKNGAALSGVDGVLSLKNSTVSGSYVDGVRFTGLSIGEFANNVFSNNVLSGAVVSTRQLGKLDAGSDYLGTSVGAPNGKPYLEAYWGGDDVYESATWKKLNAPYHVRIALYISGGTVTLEPGVKFVMGPGAAFNVRNSAALRAVGTAAAPIIFTGENEQKGFWKGLEFFEAPSQNNQLAYAQVLWAGGGSDAAVELGLKSYLSLSNSTVAHSDSWGVCVENLSGYQATLVQGLGNVFQDNDLGNVQDGCGN